MRDKIVWFLASFILSLGTKKYKDSLRSLHDLGLFVLNDDELYEAALDKARRS